MVYVRTSMQTILTKPDAFLGQSVTSYVFNIHPDINLLPMS